jgi:hypothetical protein
MMPCSVDLRTRPRGSRQLNSKIPDIKSRRASRQPEGTSNDKYIDTCVQLSGLILSHELGVWSVCQHLSLLTLCSPLGEEFLSALSSATWLFSDTCISFRFSNCAGYYPVYPEEQCPAGRRQCRIDLQGVVANIAILVNGEKCIPPPNWPKNLNMRSRPL